MFTPFPLLSSHSEASVHPDGRGYSHSPLVAESVVVSTPTSSLCGTPSGLSLPSRSSVPTGPEVCLGKSYHLHAWGLSCNTIKQQVFQTRSLGSQQLLEGPQAIARMMMGFARWARQGFDPLDPTGAQIASFLFTQNRMYDDRWLRFARWARQGFDPLDPTAAQIASFLFTLFDTHGLSPQTVKGYRTHLGSVINRTGKAKVVMHQTISDMIVSMELQRPRVMPVFSQWDLGIVLEALSKPPYKALR